MTKLHPLLDPDLLLSRNFDDDDGPPEGDWIRVYDTFGDVIGAGEWLPGGTKKRFPYRVTVLVGGIHTVRFGYGEHCMGWIHLPRLDAMDTYTSAMVTVNQ